MVKKKRQSDPSENGDESTESCDENVKTGCPHVAKGIDLTRLKKVIKGNGFETECAECKKSHDIEKADSDFEEDLTLWMCLRCGAQLCGRAKNKHALNHFKTPHSDCHSLTSNTTTWEVFCYICNNEVSPSSTKKLLECIEYLKKQQCSNLAKPKPTIELPPPLEIVSKIETNGKVKDKHIIMNLPRVRGLSNLGNTCFFNSVMQCLVQTPYLLSVLQEMSSAGEKFTLPGGKLKIKVSEDEMKELDLPPITGVLGEWGTLTKTLAETLAELQNYAETGVYTPRRLLSALVTKLPQFGGGDQHDSHELLRHLLEAVRSEDLRRYQSVILQSLGMNSKVDPAKVDGEVKQKVKFYGQQASDTMLRPEQVFRGFLVSTLECQDCLHTSDRHEYFLDLSLPVAPYRPQPPAVRRKTNAQDETTNTNQEDLTKHYTLKKRRVVKGKSAKAADHSSTGRRPGGDPPAKDDSVFTANSATNTKEDGKTSSEQSDADVEDNVEETHAKVPEPPHAPLPQTAANFAAYFMESGYNSEKVISSDSIRTSPDLEKEKHDSTPEKIKVDAATNSAIPLEYKPLAPLENISNPDSGVASPETTKHNSTETVDNVESPVNGKDLGSHSSLSSEINLDLSSPQHSKDAKTYYDDRPERPVSRISFVPEPTNEVISRGISADGSRNVLDSKLNDLNKSFDELGLQKPPYPPPRFPDSLSFYYSPPNPSASMPSPKQINDDSSSSGMAFKFYPSKPTPTLPATKLNNEESLQRDYVPFSSGVSSMSPRYNAEEGECSVQSCLNQFTALELMTGNNKVGCEGCTERMNGKDGKTVYTNATKRFLVSSPPAVLILHLKRFQIGPRCMFRKMTKHVDFPTVLDLAPFCSLEKIKKLPNVNKGQKELLYSLYGIVEHSGGMHGGHYVAYVKVRAPVKPGDPRWGFLPKSGIGAMFADNQETDVESDTSLSGYESGEAPSPTAEPPPGKWFYISDSMVMEVSEEKVLRAQAYLLFYERIL